MNPALNRAICARMDETGQDGYAVVAGIRWEWRDLTLSIAQWVKEIGRALSRFTEAANKITWPTVPVVRFDGITVDAMHWKGPGGRQAAQERLLEARRTRNTGPTIPRAQGAHRPRRI